MFGLFKKKTSETIFEQKMRAIFKSYCGSDIFGELPPQEKRSILDASLGVLVEIHGDSPVDSDDLPIDDLVAIVFLNFASHIWQKEELIQHFMITKGLMQFMTKRGVEKFSPLILEEVTRYLAANRI